MVCKKCGYQNSFGSKYCSGCGKRLKEKNNAPIVIGMITIILLCFTFFLFYLVILNETDYLTKAEISQVLPNDDGSVAVLYTDGTVKVSGNTHFSEAVKDWHHVAQIYYNKISYRENGELHDKSYLVGLMDDGTVVTTDGKLAGWSNVKELHFTWDGTVGVTEDGSVLTDGTLGDESIRTALEGMSNVETFVYSEVQGMWGCLKKDGSVHIISGFTDSNKVFWNNVKELRDSGHAFYVIKNDGTVEGGFEDSYHGLKDAVKIVSCSDWIFGLSADGRLLTHNNGNIYRNAGAFVVDVYDSPYYGEKVDISQFNQIEDITVWGGLILLNRDGSVNAIGCDMEWDLSEWERITKIYGCFDWDRKCDMLYGIRKDGSIIKNQYNWEKETQMISDQYCGWCLAEIYKGTGGVVGLTVDGKLVGDGIYENLDFSVFDR